MTLAERTITAAVALGLAAALPTPPARAPAYHWVAPTSTAGADSQRAAPPTPAEVERALREYRAAVARRADPSR
jgi:hypothetical protein